MSRLLEHIEESIRVRKLISRGRRLLVAVSGGVDSMALLHLLHALTPGQGWRLTVAHFNHRLRGRSSDADERLVRQTARKLGLPFVGARADVRQFARAKKISLEMAARQLRHEFFARIARREKISNVALAHHADDQVELFFLRLLRGSGGEGLAGMKWSGPSPSLSAIKLVRPLLDVTKSDLLRFVRENKISFREDASNESLDFQRNRVRRELVPLLRKHHQPALGRTILRVMEIIGAESEFVGEVAGQWLRQKSKPDYDGLPVAVQRRVLQSQLLALGIAPEFDLIEHLRISKEGVVTISPRMQIWRDAAGVVQRKEEFQIHATGKDGPPEGGTPSERTVILRRAGRVVFAGLNIFWTIEKQRVYRRPKPLTGRELFDADRVGSDIILRHWQAGDRFQPIGMKAAVKLQDLFVNAKIPRARRAELLVATTASGEIFWVEGLRMGERFKLTPGAVRKLRWGWKPRNH